MVTALNQLALANCEFALHKEYFLFLNLRQIFGLFLKNYCLPRVKKLTSRLKSVCQLQVLIS